MKRRNFLGFLAASPIAAKSVAEDAAAKLVGVQVGNKNSFAGTTFHGVSTVSDVVPGKTPLTAKIARSFFGGKLPDWKRREFCLQAAYEPLHPDIAILRSVSLSAKLQMRQDRFVKKMEASWFDGFDRESEQKTLSEEFYEKFGLWL